MWHDCGACETLDVVSRTETTPGKTCMACTSGAFTVVNCLIFEASSFQTLEWAEFAPETFTGTVHVVTALVEFLGNAQYNQIAMSI